jgi:hypothetical protein
MALPPLEGDIILRDNASQTLTKVGQSADATAAQLAAADRAVAAMQASLTSLGSVKVPQIAAPQQATTKGVTAAEQAEQQRRLQLAEQEAARRVALAQQTIPQIANFEKLLTSSMQEETARRASLTSTEGQKRRAALEGAFKGLSTKEIDNIILRMGDLDREAKRVRQSIAALDKNQAGGQTSARVAATRSEVSERERLVRQLASIQQQQEKLVTDTVRAEANKRAEADRKRQQRQQNFTPGNIVKGIAGGAAGGLLGGNIGGLIGGAAAGGPVGLGVAAIAAALPKIEAFARSSAIANTELKRLNLTFNELAGSTEKAEGRIIAIQQGLGGTVDRMAAMKVANQAAALSLASTGQEFGRLAQAARIVSIISPVINDASSAVSELGLAAANLSFRRLDQLGLSVTEVRAGMKALQAENSNLSDSSAFLQASIDALIAKGGNLINSTDAQASGVERLQVAWSDWWNQQSAIANGIDGLYGKVADALNQILVLTGQADSKATGDFIDAKIREFEDAQKKLENPTFGDAFGVGAIFTASTVGDGLQEQLAAYKSLQAAQKQADADMIAGVPGALSYSDALKGIATDAERATIGTSEIGLAVRGATVLYENFQKLTDPRNQDIDVVRAQRSFDLSNARDFSERVTEINGALAQMEQFKGTGLQNLFSSFGGELAGLRASLFETGELPEGSEKRLALLQGASESAGQSMEFLGEVNKRLGSSFVESSDAAQLLVEAYARLMAAQEAGQSSAPEVAAGFKIINEQLDQLAAARELSFVAGLEQASKGLAQVDALTRSGVTGLDDYGKKFEETRAAIIANGSATQEQLALLSQLKTSVEATAAVQQRYKESFAGVSGEFIAASAAAQVLVAQIAQISAAEHRGTLLTDDARLATAQLTKELQKLAATHAEDALRNFAEASAKAVAANVQLVDGVSGLPIAFDTARLKGDALSNTLNQLIADAQNLGAAAANSSFSLARGLIPSLGLGGAIQQAQQFQQQSQALTNTFLQANAQRVQQGQNPVSNQALDFAQGSLQQFQSAFVQDATRAADDIGGAVSDIGKQISDALDGVIEGILQPTTGGLLPDDVVKELLPREDALDEQARRLADVAVHGLESQWFAGLKDLEIFPQSVLDEGEQAIRRFAAEGVQRHTDGLTTEFYNVDAAVQQVIEKLQANQARAGFLDQVREQVKAVAGDVDDLDLQEALGIDVAPQRAAQASRSALEGLPTPEEIMAQFQELLGGESPLATALTINPEQQGVITESTTGAITTAGEAMVAQAEAGAYGQRAVDTITASLETKKTEIEKSGRNLATWLGDALLLEFKTGVPSGLLDILVISLIPLLGAAQAKEQERTGGTAVQ